MADIEKRREQQKVAAAKYRASKKAEAASSQGELVAAQDENASLRAQLAEMQSAVASTRELADYPAITEHVDLTQWRGQINRFYNVSDLRWGEDNKRQGNIDVSTPKFEEFGSIVAELGELLVPEAAERLLVGQLAAKIGVNQTGAVGLYRTGHNSACHCHVLPVKNLMLSGKKSWRFWAPGTVAKLSQ